MANLMVRGDTLYINYRVDGKRYKRTTKLKNTPKNRKYVENVLIPELNEKIEDGSIYRPKDTSFRYYGELLLEEKMKTVRSYAYRSIYYKKVIDYFGNRKIETITRLECKRFFSSLKMQPNSKRAYRSFLKEVFEYAVDDNVIPINPAVNIDLGRQEKPNIQFFEKDEVNKLLNASMGIIRLYLFIAFHTGMRPSEILGLQFTDIKNNVINVIRGKVRGKVDRLKTKNAYRKIRIPDFVNDEIEFAKRNSMSLYLFPEIRNISNLRYQWRKLCKDTNIEFKVIKSARHTFATHMLRDNVVSLNELSGLLGHSSPKVTLTHYASVINSINVDLGKDFNLFGNTLGTEDNSTLTKAQ